MGGEAAQVEERCISVNYTLSIILHISDPAPKDLHLPCIALIAPDAGFRNRETCW